ncbi:MAG: J domain-containing protein [Acidimicrobiales bacterium]
MAAKDYYEILGVKRSATPEEIQRAYRKLARKWHPDVNTDPEAESRFKELSEANDVLSDPETRKKYDAFGADFRKVPDGVDPNMWARAQRGGNGRVDFGGAGGIPNLDDLLGGLFGRGRPEPGPRPGPDQRVDLELSVEDAYHGAERSIRVSGPSGTRTVSVNIPAGVTEGQRIRVRGEGGPGSMGGPSGDLFLTVHFAPSSRFTVEGRDVSVRLAVTPWEAALGAQVSVDTPGGPANVRVPPGTSSGRKLRLRGRGLPNPGGTPGDLYAVVAIAVPRQLSERETELFSQLAAESEFQAR